MSDLLLNLSNSHLFWQGKEPQEIEPLHRPNFLAFPKDPTESIDAAMERLGLLAAEAGDPESDPLGKIHAVGQPLEYRSFWNHGERRQVVPVAAKRSYWVPDISDELFFEHGFYTCEHDIPYMERALADLGAEHDWWLLDSRGREATLNVLTYDIETTQYGTGAKEIPIDVIGYSDFPVSFESDKDLETEALDFRFTDLPTDWADREVLQLVAHNEDEEIDNLDTFTRMAVGHDLIAGHNVLGFDNLQIHERIKTFLGRDQRQEFLSPTQRDWFLRFTDLYSRRDRSFHFGTQSEIAVWHPATLDTFHAARKFFFFHDDFTLKGLAPWLGIEVEGRQYLEPESMKLDATTLLYNKHDVQEQVGITQQLIAQALPLCFTVNLPLESLLTGGNTKMWDHMALLRARRQRKIMPATCRAQAVAQAVHAMVPGERFPSREQVADAAAKITIDDRTRRKEVIRVAKQGPEMPFWVEHPSVIVQPGGGPAIHGYAIPGGMTLKPDSDLKSHFTPWFHVVAADVGAMYPTILKARNLTADTVRPARVDEEPDDFLWLFELDADFVASGKYHVRKAEADRPGEGYTKGRGWIVGLKHAPDDGLVNLAMTGILDTIQKVKDARAEAKESGAPKDEVRIHDMTYASLKAARNAGTHGILVAVNVSCRQFNVWGGANITTIGQRILHESLEDFEKKGIRVVYGDTDGIYLGCSKSAGNLLHFAAGLDAKEEPEQDKWITLPEDALAAVAEANKKWRDLLDYPGFELEPELHDAMVFVVHKNYLIFDAVDGGAGGIKMETKGNNFKGSDKAPLAQNLLRDIMTRALRDVASWDDEEDGRERMKTAIKRATKDVVAGVNVDDWDRNQFILRQSVSPVKSYKPNPDGSMRTQAVRSAALENLLGENLNAKRKFKFIVCKRPLPLYEDPRAQQEMAEHLARQGHRLVAKAKPSKSGLKPIEFMWPEEKVEPHMIDRDWYKEMVEEYVKGAFGFDSLELAVQRDLSSWF
ncbi:MAG: DNA polymerase elongation subunit (family B) [Thermoplasmatota archaeon]